MRRLLGFIALALVVALPVYAQGTGQAPAAKSAPAATAMTASGSVTAVSADSLTIKAKSGDMTFAVDSKVKVTGTGASHKTEELKAAKKTAALTDYLKNGDMVTVTYNDVGGKMAASAVRITSAMK
jgi:FlaG/FlaF family flagellin (archaellin)